MSDNILEDCSDPTVGLLESKLEPVSEAEAEFEESGAKGLHTHRTAVCALTLSTHE